MLVNKMILSKRKNDKPFYPTKIKVDEFFNPYTGKKEDVTINTGPYKKAIAGETLEEVRTYLAHLTEKYNDDKNAYMTKRKKEMEIKLSKSDREKGEETIIVDKIKPLFDKQNG